MATFHVPDDPKVLQALGRIALRHGHLDHTLRLLLKTLGRVSVQEALDATAFEGSTMLRERIRKIARKELGEGTALMKLQALMERARRATENRNDLIHNIWAQPLGGDPQVRTHGHGWKPIPAVAELGALENDITTIVEELNHARLNGFISEGLSSKKSV